MNPTRVMKAIGAGWILVALVFLVLTAGPVILGLLLSGSGLLLIGNLRK